MTAQSLHVPLGLPPSYYGNLGIGTSGAYSESSAVEDLETSFSQRVDPGVLENKAPSLIPSVAGTPHSSLPAGYELVRCRGASRSPGPRSYRIRWRGFAVYATTV